MHFSSTIASSVLIASSTWAQSTTTVRVVTAGANGGLTFSPNNVQASAGDVVQFQFMPGNHSVAEADFNSPCVPIAQVQTTTQGWWSGFMPTQANREPVFSVMVMDTNPVYFYDAGANNCQQGMVGAINAPSTGNTIAAFAANAKNVPQNMFPGQTMSSTPLIPVATGTASTMSTSTTPGTAGASVTPAVTGGAAGHAFFNKQ
ncbi:MAG: hypothetical protein M1820_005314 [Bogoriella megaspora]|nr:MAG: hypothetical protein M1820_005314 [Bogoriella megaspora]